MEVLLEIIFGRIIVGFFGYYTLLIIYKLFGYQKGLEWLKNSSKDEGDELGKGCFVSIVGFISFGILISLIVYLFY